MKLIVKDSVVIETYMDSQVPSLSGYQAGSRIAWVPDDTLLIAEEGYVIPDPRLAMSHANLVNCVSQDLDFHTDEIISNGYTYSGVLFPCAIEHQMNYKTVYDMRDMLTYPFTVKGKGQNFVHLQDTTDVSNFFLTGFMFIRETLAAGWALKGSLDALTDAQLLAYEDPR